MVIFIVIVAYIATTVFYRESKRIGISPGKPASIPFIFAGILLIFSSVASMAISYLNALFAVSNATISLILWILNVFVVLAFLAVITHTWRVLRKATLSTSSHKT